MGAEHLLDIGSMFRGLMHRQPCCACAKRGKCILNQVDGQKNSAYVFFLNAKFLFCFSFNDEYNEKKRSHEILDIQ